MSSTYYEQRMEADLEEIQAKVRTVSKLVEGQVESAVQALLDHDQAVAAEVIVGDRQVNRLIRQIDDLCHTFIVRHAPTEDFLRRVSAVLRLDVALERIGDYADSICREVGRISAPPPEALAADFGSLAVVARDALGSAIRGFHDEDTEAVTADRRGEVLFDALMRSILAAAADGTCSTQDAFGYLHCANLLARVHEQSENIGEQTVFAVTGETPPDRVFRVLFVDAANAGASKLAEAYASSRYPRSGRFESAGWAPAVTVQDEVGTFLGGLSPAVDPGPPNAMPATGPEDEHHHVIVVLDEAGRTEIQPIPFRTTLVVWDDLPSARDASALYDELGGRVDELMLTLAGPEAA